MSPYYSAVRNALLLSGSLLLLIGCGRNHATADAYGNFEATETVVSAKGSGELLAVDIKPEAWDDDDPSTLGDLIVAALARA